MSQVDDKVTARLTALSHSVQADGWLPPDQLRRSAERSRRRRQLGLAAGGTGAVAVIAVAAVTLTSAPSPAPSVSLPARAPRVKVVTAGRIGQATERTARVSSALVSTGSAAAAAAAASEEGLTVRLLRLAGRGQTGNLSLSPLSLGAALTMLENGASGTTRSQIAAALGVGATPLARQDVGWDALLSSITAGSPGARFQSADSLWIQRGLPVAPQFLAAQARYFHAGIWQADFVHRLAATTSAMNQWASAHTDGAIRQIFGPGDLDFTTRLVLANAAHFTGAWVTPFSPARTAKSTFVTSQGRPVQVYFMTRHLTAGAVRTTGYQAVRLPYAGGRFAAVAIMPLGQNLTAFTSGLTQPELSQIIAGTSHGGPAALFLPRFRITSFLHLNSTLAALGMPAAFSPAADFSRLSTAVRLKLQSAVQRDDLSVGEKGTSAAAVTGLSTQVTSLRAGLWFDHPFLFVITDTTTGSVLFASLVRNPAA
jgi:serpin B